MRSSASCSRHPCQPIYNNHHGCGPRVTLILHQHRLLLQEAASFPPPHLCDLPVPAVTSKHSPNKSFPAPLQKWVSFQLDQLLNLSHHVSARTLALAKRAGNKWLNIAGDEGKRGDAVFQSVAHLRDTEVTSTPQSHQSGPPPGRVGERRWDLTQGHKVPQNHQLYPELSQTQEWADQRTIYFSLSFSCTHRKVFGEKVSA